MDPLTRGTHVERTARDNDTVDVATAYVAGYADGITLLHSDGHDQAPVEPLERIYARYLCNVELEHPTPGTRAYIAGFRDAAADNLPCPPHEIQPQIHRVAA
jgi:hypothetical protein